MAINRDFIGRTFPASEPYQIGRELIRNFATAIKDNNPIYHDVEAARAAGHPDLVAPPTFLITMGFRDRGYMADPTLNLNYAMVVHGEQQFVLNRPVVAGDEVRSQATITNIADAGRNEKMTVESKIIDASGETVAIAINTLISRGTAAPKED
jgi:acyl dehydratase